MEGKKWKAGRSREAGVDTSRTTVAGAAGWEEGGLDQLPSKEGESLSERPCRRDGARLAGVADLLPVS